MRYRFAQTVNGVFEWTQGRNKKPWIMNARYRSYIWLRQMTFLILIDINVSSHRQRMLWGVDELVGGVFKGNAKAEVNLVSSYFWFQVVGKADVWFDYLVLDWLECSHRSKASLARRRNWLNVGLSLFSTRSREWSISVNCASKSK